MKKKELNETDKKILNILSLDGRKSQRAIARELEMSPITVKKHIDKLEKEGIIKGYSVDIDYGKLGYDLISLIELTISKGKMLEVEEEIAKNPNVFGVYDVTGEYDALLLAQFKTRQDLSEIVKDINSNEYVIRTNTHLILNVMKEITNFRDLMKS
jgi:Lrp/AsnC family transcriptional regulator for asnA, asnC and gidA